MHSLRNFSRKFRKKEVKQINMTHFKRQIVSAAAAGAMLLNVAGPAFAGTSIEISGNGAGSYNYADVEQKSQTNVTQNNTANVTNNVNADADTGHNDANYNTGGDVYVETGDAHVTTDISNALNSNSAEVECCAGGDTDVNISGNGAYSDNVVDLLQRSRTNVDQNNRADVDNDVDADADTGKNDANLNTGGDVIIHTGKATTSTSVSTLANVNTARVGSDYGSDHNPSAAFVISGNGAGSENFITAALKKRTDLDQDNRADIDNDVDADADTGKNDANYNTGGDVVIATGKADVWAEVDNAVNFNHADVDCGCTWDVWAKIAGNGADVHHDKSDNNVISLLLDSQRNFDQGNNANLDNDLEDLDADTGHNDAKLNTGEADSDPAIVTGDASVSNGISNSGNVNTIGDGNFDFPEFPEVDYSFNMAALWAFFGLSL